MIFEINLTTYFVQLLNFHIENLHDLTNNVQSPLQINENNVLLYFEKKTVERGKKLKIAILMSLPCIFINFILQKHPKRIIFIHKNRKLPL